MKDKKKSKPMQRNEVKLKKYLEKKKMGKAKHKYR